MNRVIIILAALALLTGCAERPQYQSMFTASEIAFHTLNVADQVQSANAISHDCFREVNPMTRGLLGEKPTGTEFALYGAALSLAFHAVNRLDYVQEHPGLCATINAAAILAKGYAVAHNHQIGMRMSGNNEGCP